MEPLAVILLIIAYFIFRALTRYHSRKVRTEYYHDYLNSDDWQRKRALVLKRDNYKCVYCGAPATQVHHRRYAKRNIGREPIEWLISVCSDCHRKVHR